MLLVLTNKVMLLKFMISVWSKFEFHKFTILLPVPTAMDYSAPFLLGTNRIIEFVIGNVIGENS